MSKANEEKPHRGRIQAQGGGVEESESWAQDTPPTVEEALEFLENLKNKLTKTEYEKRKTEFEKAEKFIKQAGENGGVNAKVSKTFKVKDTKDLRVDIEVISGKAFIRGLEIVNNE
jgi:hypothetical protein